MLDWFKETWKNFINTPASRIGDSLSGPFIMATILVFWEVPVYLVKSDAKDRIDKINELLKSNLPHPFGWHPGRLTIIVLAWVFWVFLFPFLGPFLHKFRSWIIDTSQSWNRYESYASLKKLNEELMAQNSALLSKSREFDNYREVLHERVKVNTDSFKNILKLQDIAKKEDSKLSSAESDFIFALKGGDSKVFMEKDFQFRFTLALLDDARQMYEQLSVPIINNEQVKEVMVEGHGNHIVEVKKF